MKIGYFADGPWSHKALDKILADTTLNVTFICARYDNPDLYLKEVAERENIPFLRHENINSKEFIDIVSGFQCDLLVSMSFNQIFRREIINLTKLKAINCHAGKLPFYRGRNVLNWALINDENDFGVTVHYIDEGIDTGDIILQEVYDISDEDNYKTLLKRSFGYCADVLFKAIKLVQSGQAQRISQHSIHPVGFYCTRRREGDERLNWNQSSRDVFNFVRAICHPGPRARTFINDNEVLVDSVELVPNAPIYKGVPGSILNKVGNSYLVKTKDSFVRLSKWESTVALKVGDRFE